jgi:hypothetical protein
MANVQNRKLSNIVYDDKRIAFEIHTAGLARVW